MKSISHAGQRGPCSCPLSGFSQIAITLSFASKMKHLFPQILANPLYIPPTEYAHPAFSPMAISAMEGLLLGLILWRWTRSKPAIILLGFLINVVTLMLFWASIREEEHIWDYDYRVIAIGEIFVVAIEAFVIVNVVRNFTARLPRSIWWKALGISLVLNALSFFASAFLVHSPIPASTTTQLRHAAPLVSSALTATRSYPLLMHLWTGE